MSLTISLPASPDEIPAVLVSLRVQHAAKRAECDALLGAIKAVQTMCTHPNQRHGTDIDRDGWSRCTVCDKVW